MKFRTYNEILERRMDFYEGLKDMGYIACETTELIVELYTRERFGEDVLIEYKRVRRQYVKVRREVERIVKSFKKDDITIAMCVIRVLDVIMKVDDVNCFKCKFNDIIGDEGAMKHFLNDILGTYHITM